MQGSIGSSFTCEKRSIWSNEKYWIELCNKSLTISNNNNNDDDETDALLKEGGNINMDDLSMTEKEEAERRRIRIVEDGYVLADEFITGGGGGEESTTIATKRIIMDLTTKLRNGITQLNESGLPASFILLFDETWELAHMANKCCLSRSTHSSNIFNFDILAWYVDPLSDQCGFSPHRDRQPVNNAVSKSFHNDHQAKYVTMWMALSEATPENSCLYVIPKQKDPGYTNGDIEDDEQQQDPLSRALSTKESYQNIRALPRLEGQSILFTHRILHWGSKGNNKNTSITNKPRIAISFVCSDPTFEKPYLVNYEKYFCCCSSSSSDGENHQNNSHNSKVPPFRIRLLLVCAQLLIYYQRFNLPKDCIKACYEYCKEYGNELEPSYKQKVFLEFIKAMKEATAANNASAIHGDGKEKVTTGDTTKESTILNNEVNNKGKVNAVDKNKADEQEDDDDDDDDDDEDAVLDEMLEAEAGGYGEFEDDYDEIDDWDDKDGEHCQEKDNEEQNMCSNGEEEEEDEDEESTSLFGKHKADDAAANEKTKKLKSG